MARPVVVAPRGARPDTVSPMSTPTTQQQQQLDRVLSRLPARLRRWTERLLNSWAGRTGLGWAWSLQRIEIFDRSMAVAAQLFTAVFPMLILLASWFGHPESVMTGGIGLPPEAAESLEDALKPGASSTFGIVGTIIVVVSATSLARTLARSFAVVWGLPRPRSSVDRPGAGSPSCSPSS